MGVRGFEHVVHLFEALAESGLHATLDYFRRAPSRPISEDDPEERFDSAPTVVTSLSVPPRSQALAEEVALLISKRRPRGIGHACKTTPSRESVHSTDSQCRHLSVPPRSQALAEEVALLISKHRPLPPFTTL